MFSLGKRAYEGGAYKNAVTALEAARDTLATVGDRGEVRAGHRRVRVRVRGVGYPNPRLTLAAVGDRGEVRAGHCSAHG
jgi:hypothetical protein